VHAKDTERKDHSWIKNSGFLGLREPLFLNDYNFFISFGQAFSKACRSRAAPLSPLASGEILYGIFFWLLFFGPSALKEK